MRVDIYESTKLSGLFLFVPKGIDPSAVSAPAELGPWKPSLADFDIEAWHEQHGMDWTEVVRDIQAVGYAVSGVM